jgi:hypothetical protein
MVPGVWVYALPRMARLNSLVDGILDLPRAVEAAVAPAERAAPGFVVVTFAGGREGRLDLSVHRSRVWFEVLRSLHETGQPAYVEIDPASGLITELLLPRRFTVGEIEEMPDGTLEVELVVSHARHFLRPSNPYFDELRETLETARQSGSAVLVTESLDSSEMIDIRPAGRAG